MKATLGGYRHLVRKDDAAGSDAARRLKAILTDTLPEAFKTPEQKDVLNTLAHALRNLTVLADRRYGKDAQETLWAIRLDGPLHTEPGETADAWKLHGSKVAAEPLDTPLSLVRVINVIAHLGECRGLTLADIAAHSLEQPAS